MAAAGERALRVAVAGGGPAGLCAAIGLAQLGHEVLVLERRVSPMGRAGVDRDRSYPVDLTGVGLAALEKLGALGEGGALRRRTLPFYGFCHCHFEEKAPEPGRAIGVIGTRDDIALGLLEHIEECRGQWPGSIDIHFRVGVVSVDLARRKLCAQASRDAGPEAEKVVWEASASSFDLICACDGRHSVVRDGAAAQDPELVVTPVQGRGRGQTWYKTVNLDTCEAAGDQFVPGWLYMDQGCIFALTRSGGAVGVVRAEGPSDKLEWFFRRGPHISKAFRLCVTEEEQRAFVDRPVQDATSGFAVSRLVAGGCVVLLGDSSFSPPPAGQGCGHACASACSLVEVLGRPGATLDVPATLRAYDRERFAQEQRYGAPPLFSMERISRGLQALVNCRVVNMCCTSRQPCL